MKQKTFPMEVRNKTFLIEKLHAECRVLSATVQRVRRRPTHKASATTEALINSGA